jgi:hypothetical protein
MELNVLGEFGDLTLFCEENSIGGIWICCFLEFWAGVRVRLLRRGGIVCSFCAFGRALLCVAWVDLWPKDVCEGGAVRGRGSRDG